MTDPRNIAHDKKVQQEKKHNHEEIAPGADAKPQPGKKPHLHHDEQPAAPVEGTDPSEVGDNP